MSSRSIVVRGAREHNLRNVNLELEQNQLIVFTGVSGSGKSSLAFDTLYAEGQRRYVESLSNYARQFLGQLPKPDVDYIGGLSPAISIQQKSASRNPRSTVGTVTEVSDFLRVLYARVGQGYCPKCERPITAQTREQIIGRVLTLEPGTRFLVLAPVVRGQKGEFRDFFADMQKRGFVRARVDGEIVRMSDDLKLDKKIKHYIEIVVDRLQNKPTDGSFRTRLADAIDQALATAEGNIILSIEAENTPSIKDAEATENKAFQDVLLSAHYACTHCNVSYEPPSPQLFSFNSPQGMCPDCDGLGDQYTFDPTLMIPDAALSIHDGAIPLIGSLKGMGRWRRHIYEGLGTTFDIDLKQPWKNLTEEQQRLVLHGSGDRHIVWEWKQRGGKIWKHGGKWEGIVPQLLAQFKKVTGGPRRMQLEKYMRIVRCPTCNGQRLNPQARAVKAGNKTLVELGAMPIGELVPWFDTLEQNLSPVARMIAGELLKEIRARLGFLLNVGLHYLSLDRSAPTLSGGEAQRIRLAGQIGSGLVGVLYILDEPSIGLHPRDNDKLLQSLLRLRDMGNTVLVVEHDEDTMRAADYLVDFGPGPGIRGGEIVARGTPEEVFANPNSPTGQYLSGAKSIPIPKKRRTGNGQKLTVVGATHNNLKNVTVDFPLGMFIVVTGVSGSGKSSLVNDVLMESLQSHDLTRGNVVKAKKKDDEDDTELKAHLIGAHQEIRGIQYIDKVIDIDQTPIGRTPRSNPATYIKVWDEIRTLFAGMTDAKLRGYQAGRFSFNVPGGRCEACEGNGANKLEMDFLADVWVTCPVCDGKRFNHETLQVKYRGKNISEILDSEVGEALTLLDNVPKVRHMLQTLHNVGLDYIKLGQPSPTLSGGEAQRVKLAKELCRRGTGKTLYILDEPTTGLHFEDIRRLLEVLHGFVEQGNTVIVIEHNLDVMKTADWIIDMGPDGGSGGGYLMAEGTPETIAKNTESYTGIALKPILNPKAITSAKKKKPVSKKIQHATKELTHISIEGASQHNLKSVNAEIPRNQMTVFCGPSGSGKSSLAMDTIYAEGQRRYVESLSSYARQFLGQVQKPRVEHLTGLSPAIAIEQKTTSKSPRSTVGTITEVYDYLRILYARLGQRYCPKCSIPIGAQTADEIIEKITTLEDGTKLYIMAPIERKGQEKYEAIFDEIRKSGYVRMRVNGKSYNLDEPPIIDHRRKHNIEVIVDRNIVRAGTRTRIAEAVEQSLSLGKGVVHLAYVNTDIDESQWKIEKYSQHMACDSCGKSYDMLNPHHYSFNSPLGWCPTCEGLGFQRGANEQLLIGDPQLSIRDGAIIAWPSLKPGSVFLPFAEAIALHAGFNLNTPYAELEPSHQRIILHGTGEHWLPLDGASKPKKGKQSSPTIPSAKFQYKGLFPAVDEASRVSFMYRYKLNHLVDEVPCTTCHGSRLRADSAATRYAALTLRELCALPLDKSLALFQSQNLSSREQQAIGEVLREIINRMKFLVDVGLEYLSLDRMGPTLSGGEAQRIRLASQIGSGLTGVLYVLDEPTIGLHPRDNARLLQALHHLRDLGNTLILVEHDREVIASADYLLDFGPGAGDRGGEITAEGVPSKVLRSKQSLTGQYLAGRLAIPVPTNRRIKPISTDVSHDFAEYYIPQLQAMYEFPSEHFLSVIGARQNTLRNVDVHIPLSCFIAVTGVSGSGKSSLVNEVLYNTLARRLNRARTPGAAHDDILGIEHIDKIINVDQDPIGNSPSSNPATYTGVFDLIRELFSKMPESKVRGYPPRRFSFNQKGGRCDACEGDGQKKIEMHFLPDVWIECDTCHGKRYNPETLAVQYKGKSIADILQMRISEALELFNNIPKLRNILQTLDDVGLGYMQLGQPAPTMSGGEAQRVKLAAELSRASTGKTLYLLDEPTTGLHFDDVSKLLNVLHRLADLGNTVLVVEHNLDVIKTADWIIDLGPDAGVHGGLIVAVGTPEDVVARAAYVDKTGKGMISHTGRILAGTLSAGPFAERPRYDAKQALAARMGDMDLADVGKDHKLPWELDGIKWHTQDRITTSGKPCTWDGSALAFVEDVIQAAGGFSPTIWTNRSVVEIFPETKSQGWFLHALTGHEAYVKLVFRVAKNSFKQAELTARLNLKRLSDYPGLEGFSRDHRVEVNNTRGPTQEVIVTLVKHAEAVSDEFQLFLKDVITAYHKQSTKLKLSIEDVMPWKLQGEKWHAGSKGFPPGKATTWDRSLLPRLLELIREVEPACIFKYDVRDAITIRIPESSRFWCRIKTKESAQLECKLITKPGQFNASRFEGIGRDAIVESDRREGCDAITLTFIKSDHFNIKKLKPILQEVLTGFRATFDE